MRHGAALFGSAGARSAPESEGTQHLPGHPAGRLVQCCP
ncbi:hypothetical protein F750_1721 [Streptomyces sp. PAMC 26508]|nr:hypothetical protein F750_1721 [Streptomyces sp. PAMC 26508]